MATKTTRVGLNKYQDGEPGWGAGATSNFDKIDNSPIGHLFPKAATSPNLTVVVGSGNIFNGSSPTYFAGGTAGPFTAPVTNPRIDLLYLTTGGTLTILQGAENASPSPPTYPSNVFPICEVYLRPGCTAIYDTDQGSQAYIYRDVRSFINKPGGAGGVSGVHATGQSDVVGSVEIAAGTGLSVSQSSQVITLSNGGVLGAGITGGSLLTGNIRFGAGNGLSVVQDAVNKLITFSNTAAPGLTNPMTALGDLLYGGSSGTPTRLGAGTNGQVLMMVGGLPAWAASSAGKRAVSRTVACSTSVATSQAGADYLCDGTSDQVEINAAISDVTATGGTVVLLEGTYTVDGQISVPSNVKIDARGAQLKIKNSHNTDINVINIGNTVVNVEIVGLQINCNKANNSAGNQSGIVIGTGCSAIVIDRCYIFNARTYNILVGTTSSARIQNSYITGATLEGIYLGGSTNTLINSCILAQNNNGFYLVGATRCLFTNCILYSHNNRNIFIGSGSTDNSFSGCQLYAAVYDGAYVDNGSRNSFVGCKFIQNGTGTNNTYAQIYVAANAVDTSIQSCDFYRGSVGNQPKYGVCIQAGASNTTVYPNTFATTGGGVTANIQNDGTNTYLGPSTSVQRSNSFVIAATDATTAQKNGADYVCDGTADDVEWQAALDLIYAGGSGSILAVGKTFTFANPVQVSDNTYIEGDSVGTTVKWANASGNNVGLFQKRSDLAGVKNFTLKSFALNGNATNQTNVNQYGVYLDSFTDVQLEGIVATDFKSHGLYVHNCTRPYLFNVQGVANYGAGVYVSTCYEARLVGCVGKGNVAEGVYLYATTRTSLFQTYGIDNATDQISLYGGSDATLNGCFGTRVSFLANTNALRINGTSNVAVLGGSYTGCQWAAYFDNYANNITISGAMLISTGGAEVLGAPNVRFIGCTIQSLTRYTIDFGSSDYCLVQGCNIVGGETHAIRVNLSKVEIVDNDIYMQTGVNDGIHVENSAHYTVIRGNRIELGSNGVYVTASNYVQIQNNLIYGGVDYGIYVTSSLEAKIENNRVRAREDGGIYLGSGCHRAQVHSNNIQACGISNYSTAGDGIYATGCQYPSVKDNTVHSCYGDGIQVDTSSDAAVERNQVVNNYMNGILFTTVTTGELSNNQVYANGQRTNITYDNIQIGASSGVRVSNNRVVKGANSNKPRYGVNILSTSTGTVWSYGNEIAGSGQTADFKNDGIWSVIPAGDARYYIPPSSGNWTWVNQGTATVVDNYTSVWLEAPRASAVNVVALVTSAPVAPYTIEACLEPLWWQSNEAGWGLLWRNSSTGYIVTAQYYYNTGLIIANRKYTNATTYSATGTNFTMVGGQPYRWLKIRDDNTNRYFDISLDGSHWINIFSEGRTVGTTPDQVGFFVNPHQGAAYPNSGVLLRQWKVS